MCRCPFGSGLEPRKWQRNICSSIYIGKDKNIYIHIFEQKLFDSVKASSFLDTKRRLSTFPRCPHPRSLVLSAFFVGSDTRLQALMDFLTLPGDMWVTTPINFYLTFSYGFALAV